MLRFSDVRPHEELLAEGGNVGHGSTLAVLAVGQQNVANPRMPQ